MEQQLCHNPYRTCVYCGSSLPLSQWVEPGYYVVMCLGASEVRQAHLLYYLPTANWDFARELLPDSLDG